MDNPTLIRKHEAFVKELQATQEDRICKGDILGVATETRPFYSDRKVEYATVHLGPELEQFAREGTSIPWNPLKEIRVWYWVWIDVDSESRAESILNKVGAKGRVEQDPYAEPARYHVYVDSLEDVVKLWLATKTK